LIGLKCYERILGQWEDTLPNHNAEVENDNSKGKELTIEIENDFYSARNTKIIVEERMKNGEFKNIYEKSNDFERNDITVIKEWLKQKHHCYRLRISCTVGRGKYTVTYNGDTIISDSKFKDGHEQQVEFNQC